MRVTAEPQMLSLRKPKPIIQKEWQCSEASKLGAEPEVPYLDQLDIYGVDNDRTKTRSALFIELI